MTDGSPNPMLLAQINAVEDDNNIDDVEMLLGQLNVKALAKLTDMMDGVDDFNALF